MSEIVFHDKKNVNLLCAKRKNIAPEYQLLSTDYYYNFVIAIYFELKCLIYYIQLYGHDFRFTSKDTY